MGQNSWKFIDLTSSEPSFKWNCDNLEISKYSKNWWENANNWIKWAFVNYSRPFDNAKDTEIFKELIKIDTENINIEDELNSIKNDITRTVQNEEYFSSSNQGFNKVIEVLKGFTLYDK